MSEIRENFNINNVRNCDSVYMYGILDANKEGLNYDLPSVKFEEAYLNLITSDLKILFQMILAHIKF